MSWVPAERVLATVATQRQVLAEQQGRISTAVQSHDAERKKLEAERVQAAGDLGKAILPALDHASLWTAANTVGLLGLPGEDIPGQRDARRAWLEARLAEIAHDPRYSQAELLRHPHTGSLMTAIAEALDMRGPANDFVTTCDANQRFAHLLEIDFGAPESKAAWWRYSHWADKSAADAIVASFPGKTSFPEVIGEYRRSVETVATYDAELTRLRAEVAAGEALEHEYGALYREYRGLEAQWLEYARERIVQHMLTSDASLLSQQLASSAALRLLFLRASGLTAKLSYLDGIHEANVGELQRDVTTAQQRLDAVEAKTRKKWAPMPDDKFQKLAEDRRPRYDKRWQRYDKVYSSVYSYDRYDYGSRYDDLLWWDLMTRGRYDGSYLPEVAHFRYSHPSYQFDPSYMRHSGAHVDAYDPNDVNDPAEANAAAEVIAADGSPVDAFDTRSTDAS
jgi:hypothetical protein